MEKEMVLIEREFLEQLLDAINQLNKRIDSIDDDVYTVKNTLFDVAEKLGAL